MSFSYLLILENRLDFYSKSYFLKKLYKKFEIPYTMKSHPRSYNSKISPFIRIFVLFSLFFLQMNAIYTFPSDQNEYKRIVLKNDLEVIQITNANINKSSCAISIGTGSYDDTIPGIAHLLEHLISMGTVKFPETNALKDFLSKNNGYYNATTRNDMNNYHFKVDSENFLKALEIFSCFFHQPLFTNEAMQSAINTVNEEFEQACSNFYVKLNRMFQICCNKPYNKFDFGNLKSLNVKNIEKYVKNFWKQNYISSKMKIVIFHNEDIEEKINEFFEPIRKVNKQHKTIVNSISNQKNYNPIFFNKKFKSKYIFFDPIIDINLLRIYVVIPNKFKTFKSRSIDYINYILTKTDKASLVFMLKEKNLASSFSFDMIFQVQFSYCMFNIFLTKDGNKRYEELVDIIYSYLDNLLISFKTFKELIEMNQNKIAGLENKQDLDYFIELANTLQYVPFNYSLCHEYIYEYYDPKEIKYILEILKNVKNWLLFISDKSRFTNNNDFKTEEYFNIKYFTSTRIKINNMNSYRNDLHMTLRKDRDIYNEPFNLNFNLFNYFINKKTDNKKIQRSGVIKKEFSNKLMETITLRKNAKQIFKEDNYGKFFYIYDNAYDNNTTHISIFFNFEVKKEDYVKIMIYLKILYEKYIIDLSGKFKINNVNVKLDFNTNGIRFVFSGSSKKIVKCITEYIKLFKTLKIENFERIKNELIDYNKNFEYKDPEEIVSNFLNEKIYINWPYDGELLEYCQKINESEIILDHKYFIEIFAVSNIDHEHVLKLQENLKTQFKTTTKYKFKGLIPKENCTIYTKEEKINTVGIFIPIGESFEYKTLAGLRIIEAHFNQKFIYELRTKEQIGYTVSCYYKMIDEKLFYNFVVVSTKDCSSLEKRILSFINEMKMEIAKFNDSDFNDLKQIALKSCDHRLISRSEYFDFFFGFIL